MNDQSLHLPCIPDVYDLMTALFPCDLHGHKQIYHFANVKARRDDDTERGPVHYMLICIFFLLNIQILHGIFV